MFDQETLDRLSERPISIAAVGHVNDGKSSVLQTLTHDPDVRTYIKVSPEPGHTKGPVDWKVKWHGTTYMVLRDTPGLQWATEALEHVGNHIRFQVADVLRYFETHGYHEDARALEAAMESDYLLYVVNVTEPPAENHLNEFAIFQKTKPMITLFNFSAINDASRCQQWKDQLSALGMFAFCEYDAHNFDIQHEEHLFDRLRANTPPGSLHFRGLQFHTRRSSSAWEEKTDRACDAIADLLLACVTTCTARAENVEKEKAREKIRELQNRFIADIGAAEYSCMKAIMEAHALPKILIERKRAEWAGESDSKDSFFAKGEAMWVTTGGGAGLGASIGLAVDAFTVVSFPWGTIVGSSIGAVAGAWGGKRAKVVHDRRHRSIRIRIEPKGLRELLARSLHLLHRVQRRGLADDSTEFLVGSAEKMEERMDSKECKEHVDALMACVHSDRFVRAEVSGEKKQEIKRKVREVARQVGIWKVM